MRPKDIDIDDGTVAVLRGKGGKARKVGVDSGALEILGRWLDTRRTKGINGHAPIFCSLKGKPLHGRYVRNLFTRLGVKAGIEKRVHAHGLRHTHAAQLLSEHTSIGIISKQLGHSSIATIAKYLDHIQPQAVIDTMKARKWSL